MSTIIIFAQLGKELPSLDIPFVVFLNADDLGWSDNGFRSRWVNALLKSGCRYFVCFGKKSEELHDGIDDAIVDGEHQYIMTTFHDDESSQEVIEFFRMIASSEMTGALVLVQDLRLWRELFDQRAD